MLKKIRGERARAVTALKDEFGDFTPLLNYYEQPNCQYQNPADYDEDAINPAFVEKFPVFNILHEFLSREIVERDGRSQLFVLADAGMGKTSLLLMLKLMHLFDFWPKRYNCMLLKLGENSLERINTQEGKADTVLLLDALDEDAMARGESGRIEERLRELLTASRNYRQVLITCRTQFFPNTGLNPFRNPGLVTVEGHRCPLHFLSLFDDRQVEDYLCRRFPDPWHSIFSGRADPRKLKAKTMLLPMKSLRFRPLLLTYVDELLQAKAQLSDVYQVFQALVQVWLGREIRTMKLQGLATIPSEAELWAACRLLAVYLQTIGHRELTEAKLDQLMARLPAVNYLPRLDFGGRSLLNRNSNRDYRFAHYSIQEFLVVNAIVEGVLQDELDLCPEPAHGISPKLTAQMQEFLRTGLQSKAAPGNLSRLPSKDLIVTKVLRDWLNEGKLKPEWLVGLTLRSSLKTGGTGPEMVIVPAGSFWMGSKRGEQNAHENELPRHTVTIAQPFAIGRYPVTFQEYDHFCEATHRDKPNDEGWGRGNRPVINVSWIDARTYCEWLTEQTGQLYRLPTEAEWEYAARAGTETAYWWGDEIGVNRTNCRGSGSQWSGKQTSPVGSFPANPFGLYDTSGNVWEWVQDPGHNNYQGAPKDGRVWENGYSNTIRVARGGSWDILAGDLRCAIRDRGHPGGRVNYLGFRLVLGSPW
jgi:formylglycine-generating enzyme required for sulfatase activity